VKEEIPDFEELLETYGWLGGEDQSQDLSDETRYLYRAYRKILNRWIHRTSDEEIFEVRSRLDSETIKVFGKLARPDYKGFWQPSNQGMPNWLLVPSPFSLVPRQQVDLRVTTIRKYGKTTQTMSGPVLHAEDSQVLVAAIQLKNRTKLRRFYLQIKGLEELAKEMNKGNPWSQSTQIAIGNSLYRLFKAEWRLDTPGLKVIGHFLDNILKHENGELGLQFNSYFLDLYEDGFQQIKEAFFQLSGKGVLLHNYVTRQREFKGEGKLNAISIRKLCDFSGLSGPNQRPENYILVNRVREAAEELRERKMIGKYLVTDKKFVILGNKHKN
jgi:hypothetical protein